MAFIKYKLANTNNFSNNFAAILLGKNGFQTTFGSIPLLANTVSVVNESEEKPDGYLRFTVVGFDQLHDYNFDKHVLAVNDTAFQAASGFIKGFDFVTIPLEDKTTDISPENFVGALPTSTELSYNIADYDVSQNYVEIVNESAGGQTLATTIPEPPFYVTFSQLIDKDHLKATTTSTTAGWRANIKGSGNVYIAGTTRTKILDNNITGFTGNKTLPLGVNVKSKNFIKFYVDGLLISDSDYSFTTDSNSIIYDFDNVNNPQQARTEATYYTVPAIEKGDNVTLFTGNTYAVANVSYDLANTNGDYNARMTANSVYRITLSTPLRANVGGATLINITNDPLGFIGNVIQTSNTLTFDYNATAHPGNWNLANNQIYQLASRLEYEQYFFGQPSRKIIPNVPEGLNAVRARNKNSAGRYSPYTSQSLLIKQIPIQRVQNLVITESLYLDTTRGIATRATVSFDVIENQSVTDYEISYRISGPGQFIGGENQLIPLTSFNTVKVSQSGAQDGVIRFTLQNIDRILTGQITLLVRVTPLNKDIRGISHEVSQQIIGKSTQPANVSSFIVGQNDNNIVMSWVIPLTVTEGGTAPVLQDLDLEHIEVRRVTELIDVGNQSDLTTAFGRGLEVALVSAPATNVTIPVPDYIASTYIIRTVDTSRNSSADFVGFQFTASRPPDLQVYKAYSESTPDTPFATNAIGENIINSNSLEANFPSDTGNRDGLVYADRVLRERTSLDGAAAFEDTSIDLNDGSEYPSSGTIIIIGDPTNKVSEVATYTGKTGDDTLTGINGPSGAIMRAHLDNSTVYLVIAQTPSTVIDNANGTASGWSAGADATDKIATGGTAEYITQIRDLGSNVTGKVLVSLSANVLTTDTWASSQGIEVFSGTSDVQKGRPGINSSNVLIDKAASGSTGIGDFLSGDIVDSAETLAFDKFITRTLTSNATDIIGSVSTLNDAKTFTGNVYAIWNSGQHAGDVANANTFALIAGKINSVALELGNVYHPVTSTVGTRFFKTANSMPNVTQNAATYKIVNLNQYFDIPSKQFLGDPSVITQNLDVRFSTQNVWLRANTNNFIAHSNANVKTNAFINFNTASGFLGSSAIDQKFKYFQVRLQIVNTNPAENSYELDTLNYTIDLKDQVFKKIQQIITSNVVFDYSNTDYRSVPNISVTVSNSVIGVIAVVTSANLTGAVVNTYYSANGVAVDKIASASVRVPMVTLEATGV